jgi:hypothetical protein
MFTLVTFTPTPTLPHPHMGYAPPPPLVSARRQSNSRWSRVWVCQMEASNRTRCPQWVRISIAASLSVAASLGARSCRWRSYLPRPRPRAPRQLWLAIGTRKVALRRAWCGGLVRQDANFIHAAAAGRPSFLHELLLREHLRAVRCSHRSRREAAGPMGEGVPTGEGEWVGSKPPRLAPS